MTLSKATRGVAGLATLLALVIAYAHAAVAGEKLVGTYGEERALLRFKVPDRAWLTSRSEDRRRISGACVSPVVAFRTLKGVLIVDSDSFSG